MFVCSTPHLSQKSKHFSRKKVITATKKRGRAGGESSPFAHFPFAMYDFTLLYIYTSETVELQVYLLLLRYLNAKLLQSGPLAPHLLRILNPSSVKTEARKANENLRVCTLSSSLPRSLLGQSQNISPSLTYSQMRAQEPEEKCSHKRSKK